jgi:hypothetical protein
MARPQFYNLYCKIVRDYYSNVNYHPEEIRQVNIFWFWGGTGTGKSYTAAHCK